MSSLRIQGFASSVFAFASNKKLSKNFEMADIVFGNLYQSLS